MHCEQAEMLLAQMAFGSVDRDDQVMVALTEHLDGCATCREQLADMRVVAKLIKEGVDTEEAPVLSDDRMAALLALDNQDEGGGEVVVDSIPFDQAVEAKERSPWAMRFERYQKPLAVAASLGLLVTGSFFVLAPSLNKPRGGYAYVTKTEIEKSERPSVQRSNEAYQYSQSATRGYSPARRGDVSLRSDLGGSNIDAGAVVPTPEITTHIITAPAEVESASLLQAGELSKKMYSEPDDSLERFNDFYAVADKRFLGKDPVAMNEPRDVERFYGEQLDSIRGRKLSVTAPSDTPAPSTPAVGQSAERDFEAAASELGNSRVSGGKLRGISGLVEGGEALTFENGLLNNSTFGDGALGVVAGTKVEGEEAKSIGLDLNGVLSTKSGVIGGFSLFNPTDNGGFGGRGGAADESGGGGGDGFAGFRLSDSKTTPTSDSDSLRVAGQSAQTTTELPSLYERFSKLPMLGLIQTSAVAEESNRQKASGVSLYNDSFVIGDSWSFKKEVAKKPAQPMPESSVKQAKADDLGIVILGLPAVAGEPISRLNKGVATLGISAEGKAIVEQLGGLVTVGQDSSEFGMEFSRLSNRSAAAPPAASPATPPSLILKDASGPEVAKKQGHASWRNRRSTIADCSR